MVGEDPNLRKSGAGILLIYESIKFTKEVLGLNCYDFEGSMIESVEEVRRSCGGVQTPYFSVSKTNSRLLKCWQALECLSRRSKLMCAAQLFSLDKVLIAKSFFMAL
jgi:hypothetical protein